MNFRIFSRWKKYFSEQKNVIFYNYIEESLAEIMKKKKLRKSLVYHLDAVEKKSSSTYMADDVRCMYKKYLA